jgi:hypothetical protein
MCHGSSTHFDFPAAHGKHIRSTNPIESTFATVKQRRRVTMGAGSRAAGLTMAFKLQAAQRTWRRLDAPDCSHSFERESHFRMGTKWNDQRRDQKGKTERSPPNHMQSTTLDDISNNEEFCRDEYSA